jgi:hypothetical protein
MTTVSPIEHASPADLHRWRKRGRPRVHPSWIDEDGRSRAFTDHPNYNAVRMVIERDVWPDARIYPEWRGNLVAAVYGITAAIGIKPTRYHRLETIDPDDDLTPDTCLWWREPWVNTRRARYALKRRAEAGDMGAADALVRLGLPIVAHVQRTLRLSEALRQRDRDGELCDCTRLYECDLHALAHRAGDDDGLRVTGKGELLDALHQDD